ncbi:hypothetical protein DICPUDRAFT_150733 [Dictyostelium purpureum]|uniref:Uncharacterized protein n=1 Tax=Dictyostelium purpureum TaxID=5786 RepID=F0ZH41_DICPU|nr:uncharacterized protein DICPUDRAFT_150733 [Dictyostelium purpureum]EGC36708.1 hypothetical protein DICPUDRAFT_150733 [Dictyostelium purpureum]|eukprot:XP_003286733.1 hypothetical protein DICPUDRAFT_150733 [Dictyostelium purpureum]
MLTKRFFAALATFFVPIIALSALTKTVQKDVDADLNNLQKKQSSEYKESRENNQEIFKYIMNSTKNNNQDFFTGLEKEMRDLNTMKNRNDENEKVDDTKKEIINKNKNKNNNKNNNNNTNNTPQK